VSALAACAGAPAATSEPTRFESPTIPDFPTMPLATTVPAVPSPTEEAAEWKTYENDEFGFAFQYPSAWFGPEVYTVDEMLRIEVGSDRVYPYGTDRMSQVYELDNSYYVLLQYSKNDQNQIWKDTYQSLVNLQAGEVLSGSRSKLIKVRDLESDGFKGLEYISTLSETAQTEPVYTRQVILFDDSSNVLTVMGNPNSVSVPEGANWRNVYEEIDSENMATFHRILESIRVE
jgi:hypothetical protein